MSPFRASPGFTETWRHFRFELTDGVATVTLDRPDKLNALTFDAYADLRDLLAELPNRGDARVLIVTGEGRGFCSGGDVEEIIGALQRMEPAELLEFTRMTGAVVKALRECPLPVIAAVNGVAAGAGSVIALASDFRLLARSASFAFLFTRVGLAGADMGVCAMLPRIIGQGRTAELLFTGRSMSAEEAGRWGFFNRLVEPELLQDEARELAHTLAAGPNFAHAMTKKMLDQEWDMSVDEAIEAEAQAQAICMQTRDFERAYRAFLANERPVFEGD
jgi:enoyl-CoA hydratase/carnithine racemase